RHRRPPARAHGQPARRGARGRARRVRRADDVRARRPALRLETRVRPPRGAPGGRPPRAATGRTAGPLSLARALSKFGVCSRAEAVRWIEAGRVQVDGRVVRFPARRIEPRRHEVKVDGRRVGDDTERVVLVLHKPVGYITSRGDPGGRRTVYDLLGDVGAWVFP